MEKIRINLTAILVAASCASLLAPAVSDATAVGIDETTQEVREGEYSGSGIALHLK